MSNLSRTLLQFLTWCLRSLVVAATIVAANGALADTIDRFQGAWGASGIHCDTIFAKKGGETVFALHYGERSTGFIVKGKNVDGAHAACKLLSSKGDGAEFKFVLACREEIMFDKMVVSVRFLDDDNLVRYDPDFPELKSAYHRCRM